MIHAPLTFEFPPEIKPGGTIGIVSPARWPEPEWLDRGSALLQELGYNTVIHSQNYLKMGQLAGSDAARAEAIADMFADSTIDAIMCARGGTGSINLLDKLDYKLIKKNPKPFIGFSDITLLLQAISKRCGFITYHGPMLLNLANPHDDRTIVDLLEVVAEHKDKRIAMHYPEVEVIRAGKADGVITGGSITLLQHLIGTTYDWTSKDSILFIEDVDEVLYKLAEKLRHLQLAGKFKGVKAVLVGEMVDIADGETGFARDGEQPYGQELRQILLDVLPPDVPLCFNFPCGHGRHLTTLPVGAYAHLALDACGAELAFIVD
ncbi:MAG: LD-carboxypeptidase [Alphaproteobacteria bacterium]|nr:LD-carboxypeptidase [Alphaproteobacteria bacterium]